MKIDNLAGNHLKNPTRVKIKSVKNTEIYLPKTEKNRFIGFNKKGLFSVLKF